MPPRLKIGMVAACPFPTSQGSQVLIRELSEALVRRGHSVHVVTYHFGEELPCPGITIHRIPQFFRYAKFRSGPEIRKPLLDLLLSWKLNQVVRREGIQILHCHNYEAPLVAFPVRFLRKTPIVYHSHNTMSDEFYTYFRLKIPQTLAKIAAHWMDRFIPRRSDFAIAINRRVAEFLIEMGMPARLVKFIPPGIDYGISTRLTVDSGREELALGSGPCVVYAGNLDGYQRLDLLLSAWKILVQRHPAATLVVLTHSDTEAFQDDVRRCNLTMNVKIIARPSFDLVRQMFSQSNAAVNPRVSWSGFPIKLLNYMAAGLPVVVFRGAAPPIVDRVNGLAVASGDVEAYAAALEELLADPVFAQHLGAEAQRTVAQNHNWDQIAAEIEQLYYRLLGVIAERRRNCAKSAHAGAAQV